MRGRNEYSDKVLSRIINDAAASVPGVQVISSSWTDIGTKSYPRCEFTPSLEGGQIAVHSYLAVSWPSPVAEVAEAARRAIRTWLHDMAGLMATEVSVTVEQTVAGESRVTSDDAAHADFAPELTPIETHAGLAAGAGSVARAPELAAHSLADSVRSPEVAAGAEIRAVKTASAADVRGVELPEEAPLRPVEVHSLFDDQPAQEVRRVR